MTVRPSEEPGVQMTALDEPVRVAADASVSAAEPDDSEALDAYSRAVSTVAERLIPSIASVRVGRPGGRWPGGPTSGAGSAVAFTPDGFLVTSAHVVAGTDGGTATFVDDAERPFRVIGRDPPFAGIGLGLAVPIDRATQRILGALMKDGRVRRAFLGVVGGTRPLPHGLAVDLGRRRGLEVVQLLDGSPAARAGIRPGDVILD